MADEPWPRSYSSRRKDLGVWTYDKLNTDVLSSKGATINFLFEQGLLKRNQDCPKCGTLMRLTKCGDNNATEGLQFRCQRSQYDEDTKGKI